MTENKSELPESAPSGGISRKLKNLKEVLAKDLHRTFHAGAFHVLVVVVGSQGISFFQQMAVTHILPPDVFGQIVYIMRLMTMLAIASDLGICTGVLKYAAEPISEERRCGIYRTGMIYSGLIGLAFSLVYAGCILALHALGRPVDLQNELLFMGLFLPANSVAKVSPLFLQALKQMKRASELSLVTNLFRVVAVVAGAYFMGLWGYLIAVVFGAVVQVFIFLGFTAKYLRMARSTLEIFKKLLRFGFFSLLANFSGIANDSASVLLLKWMGRDTESVALLGIASLIVMAARMLPASILQTAFPYLSHLLQDPKRLQERANELMIKQVSLVGGVSLAIAVAGYWLIPLAFGKFYAASVLPTAILLLGMTSWSAGAPYGYSILVMDRVVMNFLLSFTQLVFNVALNILFIWKWGLLGAVTATATSQFVAAILWILVGKYQIRRFIHRTSRKEVPANDNIPMESL
jgi:O-antigen/teichoic acid export membrane protein